MREGFRLNINNLAHVYSYNVFVGELQIALPSASTLYAVTPYKPTEDVQTELVERVNG